LRADLDREVDSAVDAHRALGELITPLLDDTTFYLVTGYRSLDDVQPVPLEARVDEAAYLRSTSLASLAAEANLMIGLLTEADSINEAALLGPLRERFDAAADRFATALASLGEVPQRDEIQPSYATLVDLGRSDQGIIALRRDILEQAVAAEEKVEQNRALAATLTRDVERIVEAAEEATLASVAATNETIRFGRRLLLGLNAAAILGSILLGWTYVKRAFTTPVTQLTAAAERFERHRFEPAMLAKTAQRSDELGHLARTFTRMAGEVQARQDTLDRLVAERTQQLSEKNAALEASMKQIADELAMAQRMQLSILPRHIPEHHELALFARMQAARSVGGDFYDIIELDDHRVGIVIADVSDKGVPAALLMAVCCTRIKSIAMREPSPGKVMAELNNTLADSNDTAMFVTAFYGVVDLATGRFSYANAGHDAPMLLRGQSPAEPLPRTGGLALGWVENADYEEASMDLQPGDTVFLYTDGITEAFDDCGEAFSALRLKDVLYRARTLSVESLCRTVIDDIHSHTRGCAQSDDITCVAIRFRPDGATPGELVHPLPAELEALAPLAEAVEGFLEREKLPAKLAFQLNLVLDELLTNTINYGFAKDPRPPSERHIEVILRRDGKDLVMVLEDDAAAFNPLDAPPPDLDKSLEERRIGGLGIHLVRKTMDELHYERDGRMNRLTLRKHLEN
jgi:serine phosphatase RsbU (regulator of sigma subunit)/anti-sigma regulatory factor (Ser/Thr protein kinase)